MEIIFGLFIWFIASIILLAIGLIRKDKQLIIGSIVLFGFNLLAWYGLQYLLDKM